ncbi:MAG: 50S ribosome-binding GTPase, partial [Phycisphaerae bacterium]|nr:50S ribosome-binding GTPase [Phycisphaerae bacterium]
MAVASYTLTVALAGNPNSGKSTIFNALTGLRQKTANYPGVTVEKRIGRCRLPGGQWVQVIDLPGTYSLISRAPDEQIAMEVLRGLRPDTPAPDVVICVVDASNLQRNLYLVSQLIELGRPLLIALNMMDLAQRRGIRVSPQRLSARLGVPVVPVVGHARQGIDELKARIAEAAVAPMPNWPLPEELKQEIRSLAAEIEESSPDSVSRMPNSAPEAISERLLIGDRAVDVLPLLDHETIRTTLERASHRLQQLGIDPIQADIEAHYKWIDEVASASLTPACESLIRDTSNPSGLTDAGGGHDSRLISDTAPAITLSDRIDRVLLHRVAGLTIFAAIMAGLFISIFWVADPVMGSVEDGIAWLGSLVTARLPEGPIRDLWTDGIVAGVGAVL